MSNDDKCFTYLFGSLHRRVTSAPFEQQPLAGFGKKPKLLKKWKRVIGEPQRFVKVHPDK